MTPPHETIVLHASSDASFCTTIVQLKMSAASNAGIDMPNPAGNIIPGLPGNIQTGVEVLDAVAADFVDRLGEAGRTYARELRRKGTRRWGVFVSEHDRGESTIDSLLHVWGPDDREGIVRFMLGLAGALVEQAGAARSQGEPNPPALSTVVVGSLARAQRRGNRMSNDGTSLLDQTGSVVSAVGSVNALDVPTLDLDVVETLRQNVGLLATLPAHQLLRYEVTTAHEQYLSGDDDFRTIRVLGGWKGLADEIGCGSSNAVTERLRRILLCQAHLCFRWPDGTYGNLVTYTVRPAAPRRAATLSITLGSVLLPNAVHSFDKRTAKGREARQLVPVPALPPFTGREQDWGPQANLQLEFMREMQRRPKQIVRNGGVRLSHEDWRRMAETAGVPHSLVERVLDIWRAGDSISPPFIEDLGDSVVKLGGAHGEAWRFLLAGAEMRVNAQKAGKRSARARGQGGRKRSRRKT